MPKSLDNISFNLNIALSCHKCGASMDDLYDFRSDEYGLSDGTENRGVSTKLWMTNCKHIICHKHLPDGLMPFYPASTSPVVPCPICPFPHSTELHWIRGIRPGQHDSCLPSALFAEHNFPTSFRQFNSTSTALHVHHAGLKSAARLYSAQVRVAAELLHEFERRISELDEEVQNLKSMLMRGTDGIENEQRPGLMLPPPRSVLGTSFAPIVGINTERSSLKRPYSAVSATTTMDERNVRTSMPQRGVLRGYGKALSNDLVQDRPSPRVVEIDIDSSPAFSTPFERNQSTHSSCSPGDPKSPSAADNSSLTYHGSSMNKNRRLLLGPWK